VQAQGFIFSPALRAEAFRDLAIAINHAVAVRRDAISLVPNAA
jgi:hypothetical protein